MRKPLSKELRIATPCHEDDSSMTTAASGRGRHCNACEQDVHAVAELTRAEVTALVAAHAGKPLCLELMVRDTDGAIVVADGYVHHTQTNKRALPLLAVAASLTLAACTPSAPRADETVVLVPPTPAPTVPAAAPSPPPVSAAAPEPVEADEPTPAPPPPSQAATPKPLQHPIKPIVRPQHTLVKGGRG